MEETVELTCPQCGTAFVCSQKSVRSRRKYCSKLCLSRSKLPYCHAWHQRNRDYANQKSREWHSANREFANARSSAYYKKNREQLVAQMREKFQKTRVATPWRSLIAGARSRAKAKNHAFDLTEEWGFARWTGRCEITDIPFTLGRPKSDPRMFSPSIDRIEPKLGYTQTNCRFILHGVNALKGEESDENMLKVARAIVAKLST